MDIRLKRAELVRELGLARRLTDRRNVIPVYNYALLSCDDDRVAIAATDGESALRTTCAATIAERGNMLVPVRTLHDIAKAAVGDDIHLVLNGHRIGIEAGSFLSKLQTADTNDFPNLPTTPVAYAFMPSAKLREAIARVKQVADTAAVTAFMHGAQLELHPDNARLVATDGQRLAVADFETSNAPETDHKVLLPRKTLEDILALLSESDDGDIAYAFDENRVFIICGERTLISRTVDGKFPEYDRILPKDAGVNAAAISREEWLSAMKRVMLVSTERATRVSLAISPGSMVVSMSSADVGEAVEPVPAEVVGDGWESWFHAKFLVDFLTSADAPLVRIEQKQPQTQALLTCISDVGQYRYVAMPMNPAANAEAYRAKDAVGA